MKKIYIVLTHSGSFASKLIRLYTKKEYSHVSISLDSDLKQMYSFGRRYAYYPFWGGFVQESPKFGTFKRFKKTNSKIFSLNVTNEEYLKIKTIIDEMKRDKNHYHFNYLGLVAVILNKRISFNKCFYCSEFVKYVFEKSNLEISLPNVAKPCDFESIENLDMIYKGKLSEY